MSDWTADTRVSDFVTSNPGHSRIFERLGIDFCCGGKKSLSQACSEKGLDADEVLHELLSAEAQRSSGETVNWSVRTLTELVDHIEQTHHVYLQKELPRLEELASKVNEAHGETHAELGEIQITLEALRSELEAHLLKEEQILFPLIRRLEFSSDVPASECGHIGNPIRAMEQEHDAAGAALSKLRRLSGDYTVPEDACNSYRAFLKGLEELERDLHLHIHKENNLLFPRALELR